MTDKHSQTFPRQVESSNGPGETSYGAQTQQWPKCSEGAHTSRYGPPGIACPRSRGDGASCRRLDDNVGDDSSEMQLHKLVLAGRLLAQTAEVDTGGPWGP